VFLTDPPDAAEGAEGAEGADVDRDAYGLKFVVADIGVAPAKGTAIVTFPSCAAGAVDERAAAKIKSRSETKARPVHWSPYDRVGVLNAVP
jgi:hypothetical protein